MNGVEWFTIRADWETAWPDRQTRYLAWCNAMRRSPLSYSPEYIAWINAKSAEFRALKGIKRDTVPEDMDEAFTAYLWTEKPAPRQLDLDETGGA
jgi:hypothetical protein